MAEAQHHLPSTSAASRSRSTLLLCVLAILLATSTAYYPALQAPFFFDDGEIILQNPTLFRLWPLRPIVEGSTRPLLNLSYALTYQLSGRAPWGHHLGGVVIHLTNAAVVFAWVSLTLGLPRFTPTYGPARHWLALVAALLFALHPLQTEAVAYISARGDALAALFVLTAMTCVTLALRWSRAPRWSAAARAIAALSVLCGALSKEHAAVAPLLVFLFEWHASGRGPWQVLRRHWLLYSVLFAGWLIPVMMLLRFPQYAYTAGFGFAQSAYGIAPTHYLLTQFGVVLHYLRLCLLPVGQVFDYDWPVTTRLLQPLVLAHAVALSLLFGAAIGAWRRAPLAAYGILWFFITLAPTSSVVPIADVIAERRMYLPLWGVLLALCTLAWDAHTWLAARAAADPRRARAVAAMAFAAIAACGVLTWQRNLLWRHPVALWEDSARKAPGNPRVHANLGISYGDRGELHRARAELAVAADLIRQGRSRHAIPRHAAFVYVHLAFVDLELADVPAARIAFQRALAVGAEGYPYLQRRLNRIRSVLSDLDARASQPPPAASATPPSAP